MPVLGEVFLSLAPAASETERKRGDVGNCHIKRRDTELLERKAAVLCISLTANLAGQRRVCLYGSF